MTGFLGFASIYANGLLAIFFIFVLPGLVIVRALPVTGFAQRWFVVFLGSVSLSHLFVVLIASLHLDPLGQLSCGGFGAGCSPDSFRDQGPARAAHRSAGRGCDIHSLRDPMRTARAAGSRLHLFEYLEIRRSARVCRRRRIHQLEQMGPALVSRAVSDRLLWLSAVDPDPVGGHLHLYGLNGTVLRTLHLCRPADRPDRPGHHGAGTKELVEAGFADGGVRMVRGRNKGAAG